MCQNCSKELAKTYDPKSIEDRLYKKWEDNGYFHAEVDRSKKPFTVVFGPHVEFVRNAVDKLLKG